MIRSFLRLLRTFATIVLISTVGETATYLSSPYPKIHAPGKPWHGYDIVQQGELWTLAHDPSYGKIKKEEIPTFPLNAKNTPEGWRLIGGKVKVASLDTIVKGMLE